jgi:Tfp pilus assembly protein FimT
LTRFAVGYSRRAYTLVEVLVMVAILGIAGAMVVPSMLQGGTLGVQAAARTVVADLLYAQNDAIAQQAPRRVVFDTTSQSYRLTDAQGNTLHASWLGGSAGTGNYEVDFTDDQRFLGVELVSANFAGSSVIEFGDLGAPDQGGVIELTYEDRTYRITVASFTGRVTVEKVGS